MIKFKMSPEDRLKYLEIRKKWDNNLKKLTEAARKSELLSAKDLDIIIK